MVNVGVGENYEVNFFGVKAKVLIEVLGIDTLKHPAIQQNFCTFFGCNKVFGTRYAARSTEELYFHLIWNSFVSPSLLNFRT